MEDFRREGPTGIEKVGKETSYEALSKVGWSPEKGVKKQGLNEIQGMSGRSFLNVLGVTKVELWRSK